MSRPVSKWVLSLLSVVVAFSCGVVVQAQQDAGPSDSEVTVARVPYVAAVIGDKVYVRSGPAQVYYPVTTLSQGARVIVRKEMFGWAKIDPTRNCFSYIAKKFVDPADDPTADVGDSGVPEPLRFTGTVNADHVRVRAGSVKVAPAHADEVQTKLNSGDAVQVIGQRDDYYKILCPKNCYFWISLDFIKHVGVVTDDMISGESLTLVEDVSGSENSGNADAAIVSDDMQVEKTIKPGELDFQEYQQITQLLDLELEKPMTQRDFQPIIDRLNTLSERTTTRSIQTSSQVLARQVKRADLALKIWMRSQEQDQELQITLARINTKIEKVVSVNQLPQKKETDIVVKGRIANSAVFTANFKNRRYLVLDDKDRIIFYALAANDDLDLALWVDKQVSLVGRPTYDSFSKARLLHVTHIVELPPGLINE